MRARSFVTTLALALALALLVSFVWEPPASADESAPLNLPGCSANALDAGDDAVVQAPLGFAINTGDELDVSSLWISENGVVSFDVPLTHWQYAPGGLDDLASNQNVDLELIAPLFADAVRGASGSVTYGEADYEGRDAFCIEWNNLQPFVPEGIFAEGDLPNPLPTNTFQLVLVNRGEGDFDVVINYESVQWDDTYCPNNVRPEVAERRDWRQLLQLGTRGNLR